MKKLATLFLILTVMLVGLIGIAQADKVPTISDYSMDEDWNVSLTVDAEGVQTVRIYYEGYYYYGPGSSWSVDLYLNEETGKYEGYNYMVQYHPDATVTGYYVQADYQYAEDEKGYTESYSNYNFDGEAALTGYTAGKNTSQTVFSDDNTTYDWTFDCSSEDYNADKVKIRDETVHQTEHARLTDCKYKYEGQEYEDTQWRTESTTYATQTRQYENGVLSSDTQRNSARTLEYVEVTYDDGQSSYYDQRTKTYTVDDTTNYYDTKTEKPTQEEVSHHEYAVKDDRRTEKTTFETKNYDEEGKYTGRTTSEYAAVRARQKENAAADTGSWPVLTSETTVKDYNKDEIATYEEVTKADNTFAEKNRTFTTTSDTTVRNDYGHVVSTGRSETVDTEKLNEEAGGFVDDTHTSSQTQYNKNGQLIYKYSYNQDGNGSTSEREAYNAFGTLTSGFKSKSTAKNYHTESYNRYGTSSEYDVQYDQDGYEVQRKDVTYGIYKDGKNVKSHESTSKPERVQDANGYTRTLEHTFTADYDRFGAYTSVNTVDETYNCADDTITATTTTVNYVGKPADAEMHDKTVSTTIRYTAEERHGDYTDTTVTYDWDGSVVTIRKEAQETTEDGNGHLTATVTSATFEGDGKTMVTGSIDVNGTDENGNPFERYEYRYSDGTYGTRESGYTKEGRSFSKARQDDADGSYWTNENGYDADDHWFEKSYQKDADGSTREYNCAFDKDAQRTRSTETYRDPEAKLVGTVENDIPQYDEDGQWIGSDTVYTNADGKTVLKKLYRWNDAEEGYDYTVVDGDGKEVGYERTDTEKGVTEWKDPRFNTETFTLTGAWEESKTTKAEATTKDIYGEDITYVYNITENRRYDENGTLVYENKEDTNGDSFTKEYTGNGTLTLDKQWNRKGETEKQYTYEGAIKYDYRKTIDDKGDTATTATWYNNPGDKLSKVEKTVPATRNDKDQITAWTTYDTAWYNLEGKLDRHDVTSVTYEYDKDGVQTRRTSVTEYRDGTDKAVVTKTEINDITDQNNCKTEYKTADGKVIGYTKYSGYETRKDENENGGYGPGYTGYTVSEYGTVERLEPQNYNFYTGEVKATALTKTTTDKDGNYATETTYTSDGAVTREYTYRRDKDDNRTETDKYYDNADNHLSSSTVTEYNAETKTTRSSGEYYRYSGAVRSSWTSESAYDKEKDLTVTTEKHFNSDGELAYTVEKSGNEVAYWTGVYGSVGTQTIENVVYKDAQGTEIGYKKYDEKGSYTAKEPLFTYAGNISGAWIENESSADGKTHGYRTYDKNGKMTYETRTEPTASSNTSYWTYSYTPTRTYTSALDNTGITKTVSTYYNEDGSLRRSYVTEEGRKTGTHFNTQKTTAYGSTGQVVYTYEYTYDLQKDESTGVYKDAAGKEIGHDKRVNEDGSWSKLYPTGTRIRTGEIKGFQEEGQDKDGNVYYVTYDANMNEKERHVGGVDEDGGKTWSNYYNGQAQAVAIDFEDDHETVYYNSKGEVIFSMKDYPYGYFNNSIVGSEWDHYNNKGELAYYELHGVQLATRQVDNLYLDKDGNEIGYEKWSSNGYSYKIPEITYARYITGYSEYIYDPENGENIQRRYDKDNKLTGERYEKETRTYTDTTETTTTTDRKGRVIFRTVVERDPETNEIEKETYTSYSRWDGRYIAEATHYYYDDSRYSARKHTDANGNETWYGWSWRENDYEYAEDYWVNGQLRDYSKRDDADEEAEWNAREYHEEAYNPDGTYSYWYDQDADGNEKTWSYDSNGVPWQYTETTDGVTNITYYDRNGNVTGYDWGITDSEYWYTSRDSVVWDATKPIYKKHEESDPENDGIITTLTDYSGNVKVSDADGTTVTFADKTDGWKNAFGKEWYYLEGGQAVTGWKQLGGTWYYFDKSGRMATGVVKDGNTLYAMNASGAWTAAGWNQDSNGNWQYVENGTAATGWRQIGGSWYYFDDGWYLVEDGTYNEDMGWKQYGGGTMVTGAAKIWNSTWTDQYTYFFKPDGSWDNSPGWKNDGIDWYYYDANGAMATGWRQIGGSWYYFNEKGVMRNGWVLSGNSWYYMNPTGDMASGQWVQERFEDDWYYMNTDGTMKTGWMQSGDTWYYLKDSGAMACSEFLQTGGVWYYFDASGAMATGWVQVDGKWYYLNGNGSMAIGWLNLGGTWYYMDAKGAMVTGQVTIDGKVNNFSDSGAWLGYAD